MSDTRTDRMLSLIREAHEIAEELRSELSREDSHHASWAVIRLTQADQSASELQAQLAPEPDNRWVQDTIAGAIG